MLVQELRPALVILLLLTLITGVMFVLVFTFLLFQFQPENERISHSYSVSIDVTDDEEYEILCPVPLDSRGQLRHDFTKEVEAVDGDASIKVESTTYGFALRIIGHGPANITWEDHWSVSGGRRLANLSMPVLQGGISTNLSWVYCGHGGVTVSLHSESSHTILDGMPRGGSITRTIDGVLIPVGWQQMLTQTSYFGYI